MPTLASIVSLLSSHGLVLLLPFAIFEGPIVSIIAGFLVTQGVFHLASVYCVLILGDLIGDLLHYAAGRYGSRLGARFSKMQRFQNSSSAEYLRKEPGKALLFGKLTHSAGFAFLLAAGAVRVPLGTFLLYNFLGTLPKSLFLLLLGYFIGASYTAINAQLGKISLILFLGVLLFLAWYMRSKLRKLPDSDNSK